MSCPSNIAATTASSSMPSGSTRPSDNSPTSRSKLTRTPPSGTSNPVDISRSKTRPGRGMEVDIALARQYSFSRKRMSRRSSSVGTIDVFTFANGTPTSLLSSTSMSSRVPSMPDLTPLPSPIQSSPPPVIQWLHRRASARRVNADDSAAVSRQNSRIRLDHNVIAEDPSAAPCADGLPFGFDTHKTSSYAALANPTPFPSSSRIDHVPFDPHGSRCAHMSSRWSAYLPPSPDSPTTLSPGRLAPPARSHHEDDGIEVNAGGDRPVGQTSPQTARPKNLCSGSASDSKGQSPVPCGLSRKRSVTFNSSSWALRNRNPEPYLHRELHLILPHNKPVIKSSNPGSRERDLSPMSISSSSGPKRSHIVLPEESTPATAVLSHPTVTSFATRSEEPVGDAVSPSDEKANVRHDSAVEPAGSSPAVAVPAGTDLSAAGVTTASSDQTDQKETICLSAGPDRSSIAFKIVRPLGQGTFSNVVLGSDLSGKMPSLVAIKIVALRPAGGASEERVELGLQREVDIIRSLDHPSIVKLHAFEIENRLDGHAVIVLDYCRGGDLFELASQHGECLTAPLVRRIFAELVDAVRYLHQSWVVHRDIKLENILVNYAFDELSNDLLSTRKPIISLTDLGLSRRIPQPPADVMLTTRCGSEDYAAPEILLSQKYDGRATDAWACGVVLYALIESRLPFDPPPRGRGSRSRASHRIARCEWCWYRFADNGAWVESDANGEVAPGPNDEPAWRGGRDIVAGLLRKVSHGRMSLDEIAAMPWLNGDVQLPTVGTVPAGDPMVDISDLPSASDHGNARPRLRIDTPQTGTPTSSMVCT